MQDKHLASDSKSSSKAGTASMRIALGCMGMSGAYGKTDDAQSAAVIHAAIERGVTFLDTGDFYGSGHSELLIGKAIAGRRDQVQLSVKLLQKVVAHAAHDHGVTEVTPELAAKVKAAIKSQ